MRWLSSGLTAVLISATFTVTVSAAGPASAAPQDYYHVMTTAAVTTPSASATVDCPPGEVVWGFGGAILNGGTQVALVAVYPNAGLTSVTAIGQERRSWSPTWMVQAFAVCRPPGNLGLVRVVGEGGMSAKASCPGQKVVYASGFAVSSLSGTAYATSVVPANDMSSLEVTAGGGEPIGLFSKAIALCGFANTANIYIYGRTELTVPIVPGTSTTGGIAPRMVTPNGWAWATGAGVSSTNPNMFIEALGPVPALDGGMARMARTDIAALPAGAATMTGDGDETIYATAIGAWYGPPPGAN